MMKMRTGTTTAAASGGGGGRHDWDLRPGGMVVQRRTDQSSGGPTVIRVRVKYGSVYHDITINSQSTFGELKKMLSGRTGLHHHDMKIMYKDKERDSKMFLDLSGVKDRSKMTLLEDPIAQEKRLLEMRKNAAIEKASKAITDISFEVDRLAGQVTAFETIINKGGRVEDKSLVNLIEMLMNQLLKLDAISADGEVKSKRKTQVKRIQNYVETLDALKIKNSMPHNNIHPDSDTKGSKNRNPKWVLEEEQQPQEPQPQNFFGYRYQSDQEPLQQQQQQQQKQHEQRDLLSFEEEEEPPKSFSSSSGPVVVTAKWEMFDSRPATSATNNPIPPRFKWEFFD